MPMIYNETVKSQLFDMIIFILSDFFNFIDMNTLLDMTESDFVY